MQPTKKLVESVQNAVQEFLGDGLFDEGRIRQIVQEEIKSHQVVGAVGVKEAALFIGVSGKTLYTMCQQGEIDHIRIRGALRFRYSQLDAYLDKQTVKERKEA